MPGHGFVFKGAKAGSYKVYIDNLRIRHQDGSTTPIWTGGQDTKARKIVDTELFKDIKLRAVKLEDIGK